jgi:hypothetical protein
MQVAGSPLRETRHWDSEAIRGLHLAHTSYSHLAEHLARVVLDTALGKKWLPASATGWSGRRKDELSNQCLARQIKGGHAP